MKQCIKKPIPEVFAAIDALSLAVDAHISGDSKLAAQLFERANSKEAWQWLDRPWIDCHINVVHWKVEGDTSTLPSRERDPDRNIRKAIRDAVLARDGYRCRYCGLPVISADVRKLAHRLYPNAVPWVPADTKQQHAGFQVSWLQFDHVVPHSHGGRSSEENVVISCALCNFGKFNYTLKQLDIEDPRLRPPESSEFDGLTRLLNFAPPRKDHPIT